MQTCPTSFVRDQQWFRRSQLRAARQRLFCFPYAGGSTRIYRKWQDWFAPDVEVVAVELPGRGMHVRGALIDNVDEVITQLMAVLPPLLDKPFAVMGHSMGSLIGYELCRRLHKTGSPLPLHLFVSAMGAPHLVRTANTVHDLPDEEFVHELSLLRGTPREVFQNKELMELVLPVLRSDFRLVETYDCGEWLPLSHPITVFGGIDDDTTSQSELEAWKLHTAGACTIRILPGDHFYIHDQQHVLAASILHCMKEAGFHPHFQQPSAAPSAGSLSSTHYGPASMVRALK